MLPWDCPREFHWGGILLKKKILNMYFCVVCPYSLVNGGIQPMNLGLIQISYQLSILIFLKGSIYASPAKQWTFSSMLIHINAQNSPQTFQIPESFLNICISIHRNQHSEKDKQNFHWFQNSDTSTTMIEQQSWHSNELIKYQTLLLVFPFALLPGHGTVCVMIVSEFLY